MAAVQESARELAEMSATVDIAMPDETLLQPLPKAAQLLAQIIPATQIVAHRLVPWGRRVHPLALAIAQRPRDRHRVAAVGLHRSPGTRAIDDGAMTTQSTPPAS